MGPVGLKGDFGEAGVQLERPPSDIENPQFSLGHRPL